MFLNSFTHALDPKGRMVVPAPVDYIVWTEPEPLWKTVASSPIGYRSM